MPGRLHFSRWILAIVLTGLASLGRAQSLEQFNLPAQSLADSLRTVGTQTHINVLFDPPLVAKYRAPALDARVSADEALTKLLEGTPFRHRFVDERTVVLRVAEKAGAVGRRDAEPRLKVSQQDAGSGTSSGDGQGASSRTTGDTEPTEEIIVTGSHLESPASSIQVKSYSSEEIAASGRTEVIQFLNTLPEVSVSPVGNQASRSLGQNVVRLRGLPDGATAVLIDGHTTGVGGVNIRAAFDLGTLPIALIDRIDVVSVGSSAIYGSDAIGGLVNIILKKNFNGVSPTVSYTSGEGLGTTQATLLAGHAFSSGNISLGVTYNTNDGLYGYQRSLTADSDWSRYASLGGIDFRSSSCDPGTVAAVSGTLNGVNSALASIPSSGASSAVNYISGAGRTNLCSTVDSSVALVPPRDRWSAIGSGNFNLTDRLTAYATLIASRVDAVTTRSIFRARNVAVPASNAFNPFSQDVRVNTLLPIDSGPEGTTDLIRPLVGIRGAISPHADFDVSAWSTTLREEYTNHSFQLSPGVTSLLASSDPSNALNLFEPGANSPAILAAATDDRDANAKTRSTVANAIVRFEPLALRPGPIRVAAGVESRWDTYANRPEGSTLTTSADRRVNAAFAEVQVPLIADGPLGARSLLVNFAGRHDDYDDFGNVFTPQFRLAWEPVSGLSLAAMYTEAFKAPGLGYLHLGRSQAIGFGAFDPARNEVASYSYTVISGGNPQLQPERGESRTVELGWRPSFVPGFGLGATYWKITETDRIATGITPQTFLNFESIFPERVQREQAASGVPGRVISIDQSAVNFGAVHLDGVDFNVAYAFGTSIGRFSAHGAVTRVLGYESQVQPNLPFADRLSRATDGDAWSPKWKGAVSLQWEKARVSADLVGRYVGKYLDYQFVVPNSNELGDDWFVDASLRFAGGRLLESHLKDVFVRVAVSNLFDKSPKFSNSAWGYDYLQADMIGRTVGITVGAQF
jgi:iron complex outermembrane receptor protein